MAGKQSTLGKFFTKAPRNNPPKTSSQVPLTSTTDEPEAKPKPSDSAAEAQSGDEPVQSEKPKFDPSPSKKRSRAKDAVGAVSEDDEHSENPKRRVRRKVARRIVEEDENSPPPASSAPSEPTKDRSQNTDLTRVGEPSRLQPPKASELLFLNKPQKPNNVTIAKEETVASAPASQRNVSRNLPCKGVEKEKSSLPLEPNDSPQDSGSVASQETSSPLPLQSPPPTKQKGEPKNGSGKASKKDTKPKVKAKGSKQQTLQGLEGSGVLTLGNPAAQKNATTKPSTTRKDDSGNRSPSPELQAQPLLQQEPDAYPDWKAGEPVPYAALCTTFSLIEMTTKRLVIMKHCAKFLKQVVRLTPEDLLPTVLLMINKLAPDYAGIELGIGESLIMKAIGETTGRSLQVIKADQSGIGDLGLVAVKSRSTQPTMFKPKPLTVRGVHKALMEIAMSSGTGTQGKKVDLIKKLLSASDASAKGKIDITIDKGGPSEAKFLVRFLEGKLRLGLAERTVIPSLAQAMVAYEAERQGKTLSPADIAKAEALLKLTFSELPSYHEIIPAILSHGIMKISESCHLRPGVPLKPMLARPTKSITEVLDRFENQTFTCEYKYDGERAQIHYVAQDAEVNLKADTPSTFTAKGVAAIFSRNSEDLSQKYPDVLSKLGDWVKPGTKSFVLDCETVAWDSVEKKVLPFQQLMTRKKKDVKIEDVKIKVCVFAFDLLYLNGESIVKKSLRERRTLMHSSFLPVEGEFAFATSTDAHELDSIAIFLDESVKASCEGLMVKMLDGTESGYEPSMRSRNWLKVKKDYLAGVGDSLDLVVVGAYYGRGKRASVYGAFLLACYNPGTETFETICNIGTGFSEAVLEELHEKLGAIVIDKPKPFYAHSAVNQHQPDVWLEPRYVWEVKTADLTLSPRYKASWREGCDATGENRGISLRFPRFIAERTDKKCEDATTSRQVAEMYRKQESISKTKGPSVDDDFEY